MANKRSLLSASRATWLQDAPDLRNTTRDGTRPNREGVRNVSPISGASGAGKAAGQRHRAPTRKHADNRVGGSMGLVVGRL